MREKTKHLRAGKIIMHIISIALCYVPLLVALITGFTYNDGYDVAEVQKVYGIFSLKPISTVLGCHGPCPTIIPLAIFEDICQLIAEVEKDPSKIILILSSFWIHIFLLNL